MGYDKTDPFRPRKRETFMQGFHRKRAQILAEEQAKKDAKTAKKVNRKNRKRSKQMTQGPADHNQQYGNEQGPAGDPGTGPVITKEKPPMYKRPWFKPTAYIVGGLVLGSMLTGNSDDGSAADLKASQVEVKELTADQKALEADLKKAEQERDLSKGEPKIKEVEVEKEVVVEKTPAICKTALDDAESMLELSVEVMNLAAGGFAMIESGDMAGLGENTDKVEAATPKMEKLVLNYNRTSEKCRSN